MVVALIALTALTFGATAMASARERQDTASVDEVCEVLRPIAATGGRDFARYTIPTDTDAVSAAKINPAELVSAQHISEALHHAGCHTCTRAIGQHLKSKDESTCFATQNISSFAS